MKKIMTGLLMAGLLVGGAFAQDLEKKTIFNVSAGLLVSWGSGPLFTVGGGADIAVGKRLTLAPELQLTTYRFQFDEMLLTPGLLLNYSPNQKVFFGGGVAYPFVISGSDEVWGFISSALNVGYRTGHFVIRAFHLSPFEAWFSFSLIGATIGYRF